MSWGTELWDQYENLSLHTQKGIDFLEKYSHFIRDRCAIETEYATKLRRLVKNYQPKKKDEEDYHTLKWDKTLEEMAFRWASNFLPAKPNCLKDKSGVVNLNSFEGGNIAAALAAWTTMKVPDKKALVEKYDPHSRQAIAQMLIGAAKRLGCANQTHPRTNVERIACYYSPGVEAGQPLYTIKYSPCKAFKMVMNEVNDLAGQHEVIAENLQAEVIREVTILVKDFKDERKKLLAEGARMMTQLSAQIANLERSRKNYEKASKEADRATDSFKRADADLNLSRAEVEKQKMNMNIKQQQCEDSKNEYANQLQRTNEQQRQHYQHLMPEIFRQLQELDEKRIRNIRNFMIQSVEVERNVFPIINQCLDGIVTAAKQINEKEDTMLVIERYKSGFDPPGDYPFDDLSRTDSIHHTPPIHQPLIKPGATIKDTMNPGKLKKRVGLFGIFTSNKNNISGNGENKDDYSDLPPNQRKKKLQTKIEEIQSKIHQETATRDGLMKMKGVYEQNSDLGDPMTVEGQLAENGQRLDKLRQDLHKYQSYLEENNTNQNNSHNHTPLHNNVNGLRRQHRNSGGSGGDDDSLSRSASDSSVSANHNHKHSAPGTPLPSHGCSSDSPESGIGASHSSLPESDDAPPPYYDTELLPPLGTCRALYPFEATSEGSMAMSDGEELLVIEVDQGDGWTRVRRPADQMEGFVPTTYIQCFLNNC